MGLRGDNRIKGWQQGWLAGAMGWMVWVGLPEAWVGLTGVRVAVAEARVNAPPRPPGERARDRCPATIEAMMPLLLRDLPAYVNRVNQRSRDRSPHQAQTAPSPAGGSPAISRANYAILASQPEFTPLPVASNEYTSPEDKKLRQVFFTVLERQYSGTPSNPQNVSPSAPSVSEFQHYHWLFWAETAQGWHLVFLFSRLGPFPASSGPPTPPRDTTQGVTAEAIRLWLRDCRAGAVNP
jgi:hypothetical protein